MEVLENALTGTRFIDDLPTCDLTLCLGFVDHVPSLERRSAVLGTLCAHRAQTGLIAGSIWQFMYDATLARKGMQPGALAGDTSSPFAGLGLDTSPLQEHDHFLGWQADPSPLRYSQHIPETEVDELEASVATLAREVERDSADGSSGSHNQKQVLEKLRSTSPSKHARRPTNAVLDPRYARAADAILTNTAAYHGHKAEASRPLTGRGEDPGAPTGLAHVHLDPGSGMGADLAA